MRCAILLDFINRIYASFPSGAISRPDVYFSTMASLCLAKAGPMGMKTYEAILRPLIPRSDKGMFGGEYEDSGQRPKL